MILLATSIIIGLYTHGIGFSILLTILFLIKIKFKENLKKGQLTKVVVRLTFACARNTFPEGGQILRMIFQGRKAKILKTLQTACKSFYIHFHFNKWYEGIIHIQSCNVSMSGWYSPVLHCIQ